MDRKGYFLPVKPINLVCPGTHQVGAGRPQPRIVAPKRPYLARSRQHAAGVAEQAAALVPEAIEQRQAANSNGHEVDAFALL
jgi:hypothetical protein